eukprot:scaffold122_cov243-Chaetoceros_neogracile.AAC.4
MRLLCRRAGREILEAGRRQVVIDYPDSDGTLEQEEEDALEKGMYTHLRSRPIEPFSRQHSSKRARGEINSSASHRR